MILVRQSLKDAMTLAVPKSMTLDMNEKDLSNLWETTKVMEQALDSLLDGSISVDEYCHLCEKYDVNVDKYMRDLELELADIGFG